jgi:hypothetical protein
LGFLLLGTAGVPLIRVFEISVFIRPKVILIEPAATDTEFKRLGSAVFSSETVG